MSNNRKKNNSRLILIISLSILFTLIFVGIILSEIIKPNRNNSLVNDNIAFQSKIVTTEKSYNIDKHPNIKKMAYNLEKNLLDRNINIVSISFVVGNYVDGEHNTVVYDFGQSIKSTMKFNEDNDMNGINILNYELNDKNETYYNSIIYAILHYEYFNLTSDQIEKCFKLNNDEYLILGKYHYERNLSGYSIFDQENYEKYDKNDKVLSSEGTVEKEETSSNEQSSNTSSGTVNNQTIASEPVQEQKQETIQYYAPVSTYGYEDIYNEYSERLRNECPNLALTECAELANEGVGKMASYMWSAKGTDGQYNTYQEWATKLYNVYLEAAM